MIGNLHVERFRKGKMKIGIDIPGTVKYFVSLDKANGNTIWKDAIKLEMNNSHVSFKLIYKEDKAPVGHTKITCHLIFDFKIDMTPSIKEPKIYFGADINNIYYSDGSYGWTMGSETYVTHTINNLKNRMETERFEYNTKLSDVNYYPQKPFLNLHYRPDMNVTDEFFNSQIQFFHNLIGIL